MKRTVSPPPGEAGMALVLVLGIVAIVSVMAAHLTSVVEISAKEAKIQSEKEALRYQAESAAGESLWMHMTDRRLFSNRTLGQDPESLGRESADFEPWMLDRRPHLFHEGNSVTYLYAGDSGFDVNNEKSLKDHIPVDDTELREATEIFLDILSDYADQDDLVKLNGMESKEYDEAGFHTLPRNDKMEYRAELYWLPNWQNIVPGEVAIVPPKGKRLTQSSRNKPSFFSCSEEDMRRILDLSDAELDAVLRSREDWEKNGTALEDSLDADLYAKIKNAFNFKEPSLAVIHAAAYTPDRQIRAVSREIREVDFSRNSIFSDRRHETLSVWERFLD